MTIIDRHGIRCDVNLVLRDVGLVIEPPASEFIHKGDVLRIVSLHLFDDSFVLLTLVSFHVRTILFRFSILYRVLNRQRIGNIGLLSICGL